jgi:hypothetical protein
MPTNPKTTDYDKSPCHSRGPCGAQNILNLTPKKGSETDAESLRTAPGEPQNFFSNAAHDREGYQEQKQSLFNHLMGASE